MSKPISNFRLSRPAQMGAAGQCAHRDSMSLQSSLASMLFDGPGALVHAPGPRTGVEALVRAPGPRTFPLLLLTWTRYGSGEALYHGRGSLLGLLMAGA